MSRLIISLKETFPAFEPGVAIEGQVNWHSDESPELLELHLVWHTEGKGDRDVGIAESLSFPLSGRSGSHNFSFIAPDTPHSFSGRLISLLWEVEALLLPEETVTRFALVIAPRGKEIELGSVDG